jgi:hypothetical protein
MSRKQTTKVYMEILAYSQTITYLTSNIECSKPKPLYFTNSVDFVQYLTRQQLEPREINGQSVYLYHFYHCGCYKLSTHVVTLLEGLKFGMLEGIVKDV